jgi:cytochrome bd-type quinol oxidase subunit 2
MNELLQTLFGGADWGDLGPWPRPLAYGLAALLCAVLGSSASLAQRTPRSTRQLWRSLCPLYLLVAASTLVQGDVLWVQWARAFAREHHAYEDRRLFQVAVLLALAWLVASVWRWQQQQQRARQHAAPASIQRSLLIAGACGTLALTLLRYVSFHYTDLVLNAVWLNHSLANWVEVASLGLACVGSSGELLRSYGHV